MSSLYGKIVTFGQVVQWPACVSRICTDPAAAGLYCKSETSDGQVERFVDPALRFWVSGSVVERVPDKNEVRGSIPRSPTKIWYRTSKKDLPVGR